MQALHNAMEDDPFASLKMLSQAVKTTDFEKQQYKRLLAEQIRRESESLRLYEPLPYQRDFHACKIQQCLIQKGNRTGGSLALMVEVARAVTGQDPHGKYPEKDGKAVVLGYGEKHIGRVFYDKLFVPGAFWIIKDEETGKWRVFRPWPQDKGGDLGKEKFARKAPPLIPKRFIDGRPAWEKRSEHVFSSVRFTTGWTLYAANSAGDPGQFQGVSINLYAIDEDLERGGWYSEAIGRIADCGGLLRWAALPHAKNDDLMQLVEKAEIDQESSDPVATIVRASIFDNKFIDQESVRKSVESWQSQGEDVYRQRVLGEINLDSVLMYPTFDRRLHDVMRVTEESSEAQKILAKNEGVPPEDWTRYVSIDPGHQVLAIMFLAVPPPELGDQVFVYDESYLKAARAWTFGEAMEMKCASGVYEAFIIDMHGGRLTSAATGEMPIDKYREELEERGIRSESGNFSFRPGLADRKRREEEMRTYLSFRRDGTPRLMYVAGRCPNFVWEMERFKKKTVRHGDRQIPIDEGDRRINTHAIEAVEQAVGTGLSYVKPRKKAKNPGRLDSFLAMIERMRKKSAGIDPLSAKPGISLGPVGAE